MSAGRMTKRVVRHARAMLHDAGSAALAGRFFRPAGICLGDCVCLERGLHPHMRAARSGSHTRKKQFFTRQTPPTIWFVLILPIVAARLVPCKCVGTIPPQHTADRLNTEEEGRHGNVWSEGCQTLLRKSGEEGMHKRRRLFSSNLKEYRT